MGLSTVALADDKPAADKPAAVKSDASAEIKAGTGVEKFEITGESATFPAGTTVWVWTRVKGGEGNIKHVWKKDGKEVWTATLAIGGKDWRTQSRRTIPKAGEWEVEAQTDSGASLGSVKFSIQ
jgi:hypothetical protein